MPRRRTTNEDRQKMSVASKSHLMQRVLNYLASKNWTVEADLESNTLSLRCRVASVLAMVMITAEEADSWESIVILTVIPVFVPTDRRAAVVKAITDINYELTLASIEMDLGDGELRIKTAIDADQTISDNMIGHVLTENLNATAEHVDSLLKLCFTEKHERIVEVQERRPEHVTLQ